MLSLKPKFDLISVCYLAIYIYFYYNFNDLIIWIQKYYQYIGKKPGKSN